MARVLLLSTHEMGRQPFGLASPAAWLRDAGCDVTAFDLRVSRLDPDAVRAADLVAFYLPMHTATRLAGAGHRARAGAEFRTRVSAPTVSTRRSTNHTCVRSASLTFSARSSKRNSSGSQRMTIIDHAGQQIVADRRAMRCRGSRSACPIGGCCPR